MDAAAQGVGNFPWVHDLSADDILQEAFCRALAGARHSPINVDLVRFLVQAMRSIASGEIEKVEAFTPLYWRYPGTPVDANFSWAILKRLAQTLAEERSNAATLQKHHLQNVRNERS